MKTAAWWCLAVLFCAVPVKASAGDVFKDTLSMDCPEYVRHDKKIVQFPHLRHVKEYKIACSQCHHDMAGEPLTDLEMGDAVEKCIECHTTPSFTTGKPCPEQLQYHTNALHIQCKGCHRKMNARQNITSSDPKKAPVACNQCH